MWQEAAQDCLTHGSKGQVIVAEPRHRVTAAEGAGVAVWQVRCPVAQPLLAPLLLGCRRKVWRRKALPGWLGSRLPNVKTSGGSQLCGDLE